MQNKIHIWSYLILFNSPPPLLQNKQTNKKHTPFSKPHPTKKIPSSVDRKNNLLVKNNQLDKQLNYNDLQLGTEINGKQILTTTSPRKCV